MSESIVVWGAGLLALFWLLVLPYFLLAGLLHKWGFHALCRLTCESALQAANVRATQREHYKAGVRQGMKGRAAFGDDESTAMAAERSLLPTWRHDEGESDYLARVKDKYAALRLAFDALDEPLVAAHALAVAVGLVARETAGPAMVLDTTQEIAEQYAGLTTVDDYPALT